MTEQLKLHFRGHPLVDPTFREYYVWLYRSSFDKNPIFVASIWAKNKKQAIVKAAKTVRLKRYSIPDSLAVPKINRPKGFL